jgi:hypothetical protein
VTRRRRYRDDVTDARARAALARYDAIPPEVLARQPWRKRLAVHVAAAILRRLL